MVARSLERCYLSTPALSVLKYDQKPAIFLCVLHCVFLSNHCWVWLRVYIFQKKNIALSFFHIGLVIYFSSCFFKYSQFFNFAPYTTVKGIPVIYLFILKESRYNIYNPRTAEPLWLKIGGQVA